MATKVVTGKCRLSYAHLFEPVAPQGGGTEKYSVTLLIPKTDKATVQKLQAAVQEAADRFRARNGSASMPAKPQTTIHDGDGVKDNGEPYGEECKGCLVMSVSSKNKPVVVDLARNPVIDTSEVYSGCYGRASINVYAYNSNGRKGISAELLAIQKVADGEPFGTVGSANDFDDGFAEAEGFEDLPWV